MQTKRSMTAILGLLITLVTGCASGVKTTSTVAAEPPATRPVANATTLPKSAKWEKEIAAYERADLSNPPRKGAVLFIGSSTIRLWKTLATDLPEQQVINRGFGGSELADSTYFADRVVIPYEPKMVLVRAGGNDIHAGKTAQQVFNDYQAFVAKIHARLPETEIVFISQCPTPSRWGERETNKQLNTLVKDFTRSTPHLKYVETYDMSLSPDGQVRSELFVSDRLHFNAEGYRLLAERVRPVLPR